MFSHDQETVNVYEVLEKIGGREAVLQFEVARRIIPMVNRNCEDVPGEALEIAISIIESIRNLVDREIITCFHEKANGGGALDAGHASAYGRVMDDPETTKALLG